MSFRPRNQYYLRIAQNVCLPLYIYLDDRHLEWFSDRVLQHVLSDLRPHILTKLHIETSSLGTIGIASKKGSVDTHRGEFYQFCYFFRRMEPHAVIMKTRNFTAALPASAPPTKSAKRKTSAPDTTRKRAKTSGAQKKGKSAAQNPQRPSRARKVVAGGYNEQSDDDGGESDIISDPGDEQYHTEGESPSDSAEDDDFELEIEEEEAKPKPVLKLKYRGFDLPDRCLCVVVEPWPPIRAATRAPSVAPLFRSQSAQREISVAPQDSRDRSKTPLFLPDDDDERGFTPAPSIRRRVLPPVPLFSEEATELRDSEEEDDDHGGMMQFSQILMDIGDGGGGGAELDEGTEDIAGIFEGDDDPTR